MGMNCLPLFKLHKVRRRLKHEREGVVIRQNIISKHVGVYRIRNVRDLGVREGFNKRVASEDMGYVQLVEEQVCCV